MEFIGMCMICHHTEFYLSVANVSLVITIKLKWPSCFILYSKPSVNVSNFSKACYEY
jgi:hypothetical protein